MTPDELYAAFKQAELFFRADQPAESARILEPVVEAVPESTSALELYARALYAAAQLAKAEQVLRRLVDRRPDDGWARMALARSLERQGRSAEASVHRKMAEALGQEA